jgi:hypothetical protein
MIDQASKTPASTESTVTKDLWVLSSVASTGAVVVAVTGAAQASPVVLLGAAVIGGIGALAGVLAVKSSSAMPPHKA